MVHFPLWAESSPHCKRSNANKFCIFAMQIYYTRCCKQTPPHGPNALQRQKTLNMRNALENSTESLGRGSWILWWRLVFHCLCSLWKHFVCWLLLSSACHNLQCTSYYFILLHITTMLMCHAFCALCVCPLKLQQVEVTSWCLHCLLFFICTTGFYLLCCVCTAVNVLSPPFSGDKAPLATFMWLSPAKVQMILHMKMCTALACVSLPALVHLEKPTYPPNTCWQTAHITVWYSVHAGNDSIFQYDWGLIFIPSCR